MKIPGEVVTLTTRGIANEEVDKQQRYDQIIEVLKDKEMTAKEIAVELFKKGYIPSSERNFTAPRLTELSQKGIVEPFEKKKCSYTGKTVAVYHLIEGQTTIYDFIK